MGLGILEEQMGRIGNRKSVGGGQLRGQAVLILKAVEVVASCSTPDAAPDEKPGGTHERGRGRDPADEEEKSSADAFPIRWEGFCLFWEC